MAEIGIRLGKIEHGAGSVPALLIPGSHRRLALALAVSAGFVAVGVVLLAMDGPERRTAIVGMLSIIVFGFGGIISLYGIARDVGRVALSTAGVHGGRGSELFVPWSSFTGIQPFTIGRGSMVGLAIVDAPGVRIPRRLAAGRSLSKAMYGIDVQVGGPVDEQRALLIAAIIAYYAEDPTPRDRPSPSARGRC